MRIGNRRERLGWVLVAIAPALASSSQGCSCEAKTVEPSGSTSGGGGEGASISVGVGNGSGGGNAECTTPCGSDEICSHGTCVPLVECQSDDDCSDDTTCDPAVGCVPWEGRDPAHDENCVNAIAAGILSPKVKCEFSTAPAGDAFPAHVDVQGTPIVVNFHQPASSGPPSIAAAFTATVPDGYTENLGVIRILRGTDCSLEANLGGNDVDGDGAVDWLISSASLAAGDLDGDGIAEIVAYGADGSTMAFTKKDDAWSLLWKARATQGGAVWVSPIVGNWAGPSIYDLNDDGVPEVLREGAVISADGVLLSPAPNMYGTYSNGLFPVAANLDDDADIEMTNGAAVWAWTGGAWALESYFPGMSQAAPGHVAIANFGPYGTGLPAPNPEMVVVRGGQVMIYAMTGEFVQAPIAVPGGGGGPPTVADFDGDGLPEFAVAGEAYYTIYDIDCGANPRPGGVCPTGTCDFSGGSCAPGGGIAWSRSTQDYSSNITGSSVFDFEADGKAEVVYADECFVRVYDGPSGEVVFSQYRSSCTWYENPIIADVDGNFRADLVTPSNKACSANGQGILCETLNGDGVDPQFAGLRCEGDADCVSGNCDSGLCRCAADADCCAAMNAADCLEEGFKCAPPPAGAAGTGNTCRAAHPHGVSGIRVYSDANDNWVRSRTIWNQHAYAVTHVNEDGTIPKTSDWQNNWDDPTLNNFRQNVPGTKNGAATGDATAGAADYSCAGASATLSAPICNRGVDPIGAGLSVGFYVGGELVCQTETSENLESEQCETVTCAWSDPPANPGGAVDVTVIPNDDGAYSECKAGNNEGHVLDVYCQPPP